jgi:2,4-diaminopentanoate dehydrogenase
VSAPDGFRVAVWSTGWIGSIAVRAAHRRADMELVGVWVHSPDKEGKDAGELAGMDPIGLAATNDVDVILAARPQCVIYAASGPQLDAAAVPDYVRLLEAGVNVVTVTSWSLVYPPAFEPTWLGQLTAAAERGGASLYASGIEPGFAADQLPLVLATMSNTIRSVRSSELFLYDQYPVEFVLRDSMGFGLPLDATPLLALPGAQAATWGPSIRLIAAGLGAAVEEVREYFDRVPTDRTLEVACGTIEAGTCGAVRTQTVGVVDGRECIVIEHVNRMAVDLAPEWPIGERDGTYTVHIEGDPDIDMAMTVGDPGAATAGAMVATAMRIVNAVPHVIAAPPGLVSSLDLPLTTPRDSLVA